MYYIVYDIVYDVVYDIVYDICHGNVLYRIWYCIRYWIRYLILRTYIYLWYVIGLDLTPVVQMFPQSCFNLCFDCFCVQIRRGFICSVQFVVGTSTNRTLPCVTHGCSCHLRTVQNKQVAECSAQANEVFSKTEVDILWTWFVQAFQSANPCPSRHRRMPSKSVIMPTVAKQML